jgi:hypothetical protein
MKDRSDNLTFELLPTETHVFPTGDEALFGEIVGDITRMSAANLLAGAANARTFIALPRLQPARYQPVRLSRRKRRA